MLRRVWSRFYNKYINNPNSKVTTNIIGQYKIQMYVNYLISMDDTNVTISLVNNTYDGYQ